MKLLVPFHEWKEMRIGILTQKQQEDCPVILHRWSAKGNLVREIDVLGGVIGREADRSSIRLRRLNTRKGLAVQSSQASRYRPVSKRDVKNHPRDANIDSRGSSYTNLTEPTDKCMVTCYWTQLKDELNPAQILRHNRYFYKD